jgi:hypothetical protein
MVMVAVWYLFAADIMHALGVAVDDPDNPVIGLDYFWTPNFLFLVRLLHCRRRHFLRVLALFRSATPG